MKHVSCSWWSFAHERYFATCTWFWILWIQACDVCFVTNDLETSPWRIWWSFCLWQHDRTTSNGSQCGPESWLALVVFVYVSRVGVVKTSSWNAYRVWSSFCWEQHDRAMTTLRVWSSFCRGRHNTNNPQIESVSCSWKLFDLSLGNIWLSFVWFFHMEASVEGWWWYLTRGQKGWVRIPRGAAVFNTYM